jgi:hypothetical protein
MMHTLINYNNYNNISTMVNNEPKKLEIRKNDSKHLSKTQIKKAQFLFENDYFIWNEAEMFLRVFTNY